MGLWVRPTVSIASKALVVKNNEIRLVTDSSGKPMCQINNGTVWQTATTSTTALALNEWSYVSCVYDRSNIKIYIDGVLQKTQTMSNVDIQNTYNPLKIGKDDSGTYGDFQGYIDDFKVYNYARSAGQVKADFTGKATPKGAVARSVTVGEQTNASEGLVGYWKMDEASWAGVANEVVDSSGNANHGVAAGGATKANTTSTAKFGMAGNFDGVDDYVSVGNTISGVQTIEFWIKPTSNRASIVNLTSSAYIAAASGVITATGLTGSRIYVNGVIGSTLTANVWQHIVVTATVGLDSNAITIGKANGAYTAGQIDDVKIYNKARTAEQVRRDYESGPPPVARWKMDENAGQYAYDTSGNNTTGTLGTGATADSADPQWAQGKYGSALKFDGSNDYVDAGTSSIFNLTGNFSVSLWTKINTASAEQAIISKDNANSAGNYSLELTTNKIYFGYYNVSDRSIESPAGTITTNTWYHITGTWDGTKLRLYINGILQNTSADLSATPPLANIGKLAIGARRGTGLFTNGSIDDVRIYNYARTQKQIMEDMLGSPKLISEGGTGSYVAYWPMDEGAGDTAYDKSVNHNNGDLAGACPGAATCPTWTTNGKFGKALSFDGGDYVDIADNDSLSPNVAVSVSAWVKRTGTSGQIAGKWGVSTEYSLYINGGVGVSEPGFFISSGGITAADSNTVIDTNWHHLVGTYDGANIRIYIDGILKGTQSKTGNMSNTAATFSIGRESGQAAGLFSGSIDEVKIYPFALSPAEIKEEFNRGASLKLGSVGGRADLPTSTDSAALEYCIPGDSSPCAVPIARWKMDEKTGQYANDISGNGNTGTLGTGATADASDPTWKSSANCHSGSCLKFDGSNDYVSVLDNASLKGMSAISVEAWIKPNSIAAGYKTIISRWYNGASGTDRPYLLEQNGAQMDFGINTPVLATINSPLSVGNWYHIVGVYDSAGTHTKSIYINGVLNVSDTLSSGVVQSANTINPTIGLDWVGSTHWFNGTIDDIRIYNYARTPAQIAYDYNRGAPVAWWKMNDGQNSSTTCDATTSVVRDSSYTCLNGGVCNTGALSLGGSPATSSAWSEGKYGCGLTLDGVNDYVIVPNTASVKGLNAATISLWYKPVAFVTDGAIYYESTLANGTTRFAIFQEPSGQIMAAMRDTNSGTPFVITVNSAVSLGNWYHLVLTVDANTDALLLYKNGVLIGRNDTAKAGFTTDNPINPIAIGSYNYTSSKYINGIIDDVRIYNYALTATQVKTLYNQNSAVRFGPTEGLP
ncbi:MAG: LamG domain-containing protein [Candidatus Gribaldobacteria bacterium]|nr:LamG domain-containing protein [Candidatus Gribaldobacteria bacterium]